MVSITSRPLLRVGLLVGLASACAHPRNTGQEQVADTTHPKRPSPSTVTSSAIQRNTEEPIEMALQGRVSGVDVSRTPSGGIAVRIRGAASFLAGSRPLYVLDGIPIEPGPNGAINGLNAHDIESIEVLKDPVSTAMYGVRGANGVIVIKTKVGNK